MTDDHPKIFRGLGLPGEGKFEAGVLVWDLFAGKRVGEYWQTEGFTINDIALSPHAGLLAAASGTFLHIWSIQSGNRLQKLRGWAVDDALRLDKGQRQSPSSNPLQSRTSVL